MYESFRDPSDYPPTAAAIAEAMHDWLSDEIKSSSEGRNAYLDNFESLVETIKMPIGDPSNMNAYKALGHYTRLRLFTPEFVAHSARDEVTAKQLFFIQMNLSGLFRKQCYMQASSQAEYEQLRFSGDVLGIDIPSTVADCLAIYYGNGTEPDFNKPAVSLEDLVPLTMVTNDDFKDIVTQLHTTGSADLGKEQSPSVNALKRSQEQWLCLATDYIIFAAEQRGGDITKVPFWEAKSISDEPQIYYPFAA